MESNATTWNELPEQRPTAGSSALAARLAPVVKWVSIAVIVIALDSILRWNPVTGNLARGNYIPARECRTTTTCLVQGVVRI